MSDLSRRRFVQGTLTAGAVAGMGDFAFLDGLPSAQGAEGTSKVVRLSLDVEPLARLIEETPQNKVLEKVAEQIGKGASYQQLLAATMLAGVRGIEPRPVGFEFHTVLVMHSAHLAALDAADRDRWLPLFWAIDNFKDSQATKKRKRSTWRLRPLTENKLPPSHQAREAFIEAMDNWDVEKADVAVAQLVRTASSTEVAELFWRYGARDFRDIGHKAIYAANGWRTLQTIGWRHAEPVMRSMAYALLQHEGDSPAKRNDGRDMPWRNNLKRAATIRKEWHRGRKDAKAATEIVSHQRSATAEEGSAQVVELLNKKVDPSCIWDGLFLTAGELLMRQPGIVALHCVTTLNALYFAYQTTGNDETRRMMMLQGAAFLPLFRGAMQGRGKLRNVQIDKVEPFQGGNGDKKEAISLESIYRDVSNEPLRAAQKTMGLLQADPERIHDLISAGRRLIFTKGNNSHDYKFSSAALEDFYHVSPPWRDRYLAACMHKMRGTRARDNGLVERARAAFS